MRKLYTLQDLRDRGILYHPEYLRKIEKDGKFPRRVPIGGGRAVVWDGVEIEQYINDRLAARSGAVYRTRVMVPDAAA